MPIETKKIEITDVVGPATGDATAMKAYATWFNKCGEAVKLKYETTSTFRIEKAAREADGFKVGTQPSDLNTVYLKASSCIAKKDTEGLVDLLNTDFMINQVKGPGAPERVEFAKGTFSNRTSELWNVCQNLSALYSADIDHFASLVEQLIEANDESLYSAFSNCLNKSELSTGLLMSWNAAMEQDTLAKLFTARRYGQTLKQSELTPAIDKGRVVEATTDNIITMVENVLRTKAAKREAGEPAPDTKLEHMKARFENLSLKLKIIKGLREHEEDFAEHTGVKGIPKSLGFFPKTNTQQKISDIYEAMGVNPKAQLDLHPQAPDTGARPAY